MTDSSASQTVLLVASQIREYLAGRPAAGDDLEGVTGWWRGTRGPTVSPDDIQRALDDLVLRGAVRETRGGDGRLVYTLTAARPGRPDRR